MTYVSFIVIIMFFLIALGKKWEIKFKIVLPWTFLMVVTGCISLYFLNKTYQGSSQVLQVFLGLIQAFMFTGIILSFLFFRDPKRIPPAKDRIILSPADGTVIYIKEIHNNDFPFAIKGRNKISLKEFTGNDFAMDHGIQIGIMMTYTNVHVNRTPIPGKIECIRRVSGSYLSLKKASSLIENERVFTLVKGDEFKVGIVQIASRLVRRIVSFVQEGDSVQTGQKIGKITLGSQVDILIPYNKNLNISVRLNEDVKAGISIIGTY